LFTEGRAFVTLQFDGPPGMLPPPDFLTDVGVINTFSRPLWRMFGLLPG